MRKSTWCVAPVLLLLVLAALLYGCPVLAATQEPVIVATTTGLQDTTPVATTTSAENQGLMPMPVDGAPSSLDGTRLAFDYVPAAPGWTPPGVDAKDIPLKEPGLAPSGALEDVWVKVGKYLYNKITGEWQIPVTSLEGGILTPLDENTTDDFFSRLKLSLSYRFWTAPETFLLIGGRSLFLTGAYGEAGNWGIGIDTTTRKTNVDDDGRWRLGGMYINEGELREVRLYWRYAVPALSF